MFGAVAELTIIDGKQAEFEAVAKELEAAVAANEAGVLYYKLFKVKDSATTYAASLRRLRQRVAADVATGPDLPFVFGQVLPHDPPLERFTHRKEIRTQMAACDADSKKPEAMTATKMVSTDGFSLLPDTVHYDADGQLRLGKAFAAAMKTLQK